MASLEQEVLDLATMYNAAEKITNEDIREARFKMIGACLRMIATNIKAKRSLNAAHKGISSPKAQGLPRHSGTYPSQAVEHFYARIPSE